MAFYGKIDSSAARGHPLMIGEHSSYNTSPHIRKHFIAFGTEETGQIQKKLDTKLEPEYISFRPSAQGALFYTLLLDVSVFVGSVGYIEGWRSFNLANGIFGFNGWCSEILNITTDFVMLKYSIFLKVGRLKRKMVKLVLACRALSEFS
jgi:recombination DNA repair RAD52 pathway protein